MLTILSLPYNGVRALVGIALLLAISATLSGCDQPNVVANTGENTSDASHPSLLARTGTIDIDKQDLPLADQIKLFNLDYQLHQLTSASLRETIERASPEANDIDWHLNAPSAPKSQIDLSPDWTRGNENSPWHMSLFCTLQSRPCSELLVALSNMSEHMQQGMYIQYYHFWHGFHKHAVKIAGAAHCMQASAKPTFLQALQIKQGQIDMAVLSAAIDLYSPKPDDVYACMQSDKTLAYLRQRYDQIQEFGIRKAPSAFLNHTYLARGYELSQLFLQVKDDLNMESAPLRQNVAWLQSWQTQGTKRNQEQDWALAKANDSVLRISVGSRIGDAYVASITAQGFGLYKDGKVEFIGQPQTSQNQLYSTSQSTNGDRSNTHQAATASKGAKETTADGNQKFIPEDAKARYEAVIADLPKQPLPQNWLDQQLMRQGELEQDFHLTEGQFEDKSLVKLDNDNIDPFYETLGMQPGDVIMRVNDEWIHEESNTLFQTLSNEEEVTISVMRKGKPVHFAFQVTQ